MITNGLGRIFLFPTVGTRIAETLGRDLATALVRKRAYFVAVRLGRAITIYSGIPA
jgi:hypothetical protein